MPPSRLKITSKEQVKFHVSQHAVKRYKEYFPDEKLTPHRTVADRLIAIAKHSFVPNKHACSVLVTKEARIPFHLFWGENDTVSFIIRSYIPRGTPSKYVNFKNKIKIPILNTLSALQRKLNDW